MATIDLTLDDITIPAISGYTPPFGTKKASGGLTTQEINDNILAYFTRKRPIIVIEDSDTSRVEYDASLLINTNNVTLTLGAGTYVGCVVTVAFPAGGHLQYTSKIGVVTDTLRPTSSIRYVWKGTWWEADIGKCAVDDVLFQLPDVPTPGLQYGGQWEEHPYAGMFLRTQGGNAKAFTTPIAGSFTSDLVFAASAALPSGVAAGDLVIAGSEYRTIQSISGQNITINSAFSNRSNITNLLVGHRGRLPNIYGSLATVSVDHFFLPTSGSYGALTVFNTPDNTLINTANVTLGSHTSGIVIDASKTTGTGKDIYTPGALPEAVSITCKPWLRLA